MMKKLIPLIIVMVLFIIPLVNAESSFIFKKGENTSLNVPVFKFDNSKADVLVNCYLSLNYPNKTLFVDDTIMTYDSSGYFKYNIDGKYITEMGTYYGSIRCDNGADYGFSTFTIDITPNGEERRGDVMFIFIYSLFGVILFIMMFLMIMNIAKLATFSTTIYNVATCWGIYFVMIFLRWLIFEYITGGFIRDNIDLILTITAFTHVVLPILALVITIFVKSTQKGKPLGVEEMVGRRILNG